MSAWGAALEAANALTAWAIRAGIPRPPYTRRNAIVVETIGRRSGKPRRVPVGYLKEAGRLVVVAEDGLRAHWVRNALAQGGWLRVHHRGRWRPARLRIIEGDPEAYLRRMNAVHAFFVRRHSTTPAVVEIAPEDGTGPRQDGTTGSIRPVEVFLLGSIRHGRGYRPNRGFAPAAPAKPERR